MKSCKEVDEKYIDDLTNLCNRRFLFQKGPQVLDTCKEQGKHFSVMFIDIDNFKEVNDVYGHSKGDEVLKQFGQFLKEALRNEDFVCRYGGDEFICILPGTNYNSSEIVANRILGECRNNEFSRIKLTISAGISSYPENEEDFENLFEFADRNLYSAKRHGRDQIGHFREEKKELIIPSGQLVGRTGEFEAMEDFVKEREKQGGVICVSGQIGIGKTRLVREFFSNSDFAPPKKFMSNLSATTKSIPYYPFRDIIRGLVEDAEKDIISELSDSYQMELGKVIPEFASTAEEASNENVYMVDKFRLFEGVKRLFKMVIQQQALFLFLDNINWGDARSLELLHYLIRELEGEPVFFFLVYRLEETHNKKFQEVLQALSREGFNKKIELPPLEPPEVARMISFIIDSEASNTFTEYVNHRTGGNPFFIEELLTSLKENKALIWKGQEWVFKEDKDISIPNSLKDIVSRKLSMLGEDARKLINYAAVVGKEFRFDFIKKIAAMNEGQLFDALDELFKTKLIKESQKEIYYFPENIIREIVYNQLSDIKNKRYHQKAGEILLEEHSQNPNEVAEELAHHFHASGDNERSVNFSVIAAQKSKEAYANAEALNFCNWALQVLDDSIDDHFKKEIECRKIMSQVLNAIGKNETAIDNLEEALKRAQEYNRKSDQADCSKELAQIYTSISEYDLALSEAKKAKKVYSNLENQKGIAESLNILGRIHFCRGRYQQAINCHEQALELSKQYDYPTVEASSLNKIALVLWNLGKYKEALEKLNHSLAIRKKTNELEGKASTLNSIGIVHKNLGNLDKSIEYCKRALTLRREIGRQNDIAVSLNNIANIYQMQGNYKKAFELYKEGLSIIQKINNRVILGVFYNNIGLIHYSKGNLEEAFRYHEKALQQRKECKHTKGQASSLTSIGDIYRKRGNYPKALALLNKSLELSRANGLRRSEAMSLNSIATVHLHQGRYEEALEYSEKSNKIASEIEEREVLLKSYTTLGDVNMFLEKYDQAEQALKEAQELAAEMGMKPDLVKVLLAKARLSLLQGLIKQTKSRLEEANEVIDEISDGAPLKAEAQIIQGRILSREGETGKAERALEEGLFTFKEVNYRLKTAQALYYQARLYSSLSQESHSKELLKKAKEIFQEIGARGWLEIVNRAAKD